MHPSNSYPLRNSSKAPFFFAQTSSNSPNDHERALLIAVRKQCTDIVKQLLNTPEVDTYAIHHALDKALEKGYLAIAKELLACQKTTLAIFYRAIRFAKRHLQGESYNQAFSLIAEQCIQRLKTETLKYDHLLLALHEPISVRKEATLKAFRLLPEETQETLSVEYEDATARNLEEDLHHGYTAVFATLNMLIKTKWDKSIQPISKPCMENSSIEKIAFVLLELNEVTRKNILREIFSLPQERVDTFYMDENEIIEELSQRK